MPVAMIGLPSFLSSRLLSGDFDNRLHIGKIGVAKVAFDLVAFGELAHGRHFFLAKPASDFGLPVAARLEGAAGRRIHRRRDIAFEHDVLFLDRRVRDGNG